MRRACSGVLVQDIDSGLAESLGLDTPHGVPVAELTTGAPAEKAGLQIHDVITELNGQQIANSRKLMAVAEKLTVGRTYPLVILRMGTQDVTTTADVKKAVEESRQNEHVLLYLKTSEGTRLISVPLAVK